MAVREALALLALMIMAEVEAAQVLVEQEAEAQQVDLEQAEDLEERLALTVVPLMVLVEKVAEQEAMVQALEAY